MDNVLHTICCEGDIYAGYTITRDTYPNSCTAL